jgi:uncharacterized protein YjbI with pentapeptide repeats
MKFGIEHKETGKVLFECELDDKYKNSTYAIQLGLAIQIVLDNKADFVGADLRFANCGIDLQGSDLQDPILKNVEFSKSDLQKARLIGANLHDPISK